MSEVPSATRTALLALGANLGDPVRQLDRAVRRLRGHLGDVRVSEVYRTAPEGGADQPDYVNAVVRGTWSGTPAELLEVTRGLEEEAGRIRSTAGAPRTLDVDIVFLGDAVVDHTDLKVPHPRWADRAFVVVPLLEVAPEWIDPVSGRSVAEMAEVRGWHPGTLEPAVHPAEPNPLEEG